MTPDVKDVAETRALLDHLPDLYFAILKSAHIERPSKTEVRCTFEIPVLGRRTTTASNEKEAIQALLKELADVLTEMPAARWPATWRAFTSHTQPAVESQRFQSKVRQFTVGVTMPEKLKASLDRLADKQQLAFAEIARRLTTAGFEDFDRRCFSEGSSDLLNLLSSELGKVGPTENEQVMVRLEPHLAIRLRAAAKEYQRSASEFCAMCLAHGLALHTQMLALEQKIAVYRGAGVRKLAPKVGLDTHVALLAGVIAGSITAPSKVLVALSHALEAPEAILKAFFSRSFQERVVPAFKADKGKPYVAQAVTSWKQAVQSLDLSDDQTRELLKLDDD